MKIIHVLNHFLPGQAAGTEVYTWALAKEMQEDGIETAVVIPGYGKKEPAEYLYDNIPVFQYAETSLVDRSLIMGKRVPDGLKNFITYLKKQKPDIVHFHELAGSNGITLHHVAAAKESGAKVIMTFHLAGYVCKTGTLVYSGKTLCDGKISISKCSTCYLNYKSNHWVNPVIKLATLALYKTGINTTHWNTKAGTALGTSYLIDKQKSELVQLIGLCDKVVTLTKWFKQVLLLNDVPENKISFIRQGLPFYREDFKSKPDIKFAPPLKLIFLGRISPFKGLHLLLEAILSLPSDKVRLDIYGQSLNDEYEKSLREKTAAAINISWKGKLSQPEVISTMKQYDTLCLCSTFSEMSPLVIQEAFASGIPVIASNVYGNAEQIMHGENGLLFEFNNVSALRQQIENCIQQPLLLAQLKKNISSVRTFKEVGTEYKILYRQIHGQKAVKQATSE